MGRYLPGGVRVGPIDNEANPQYPFELGTKVEYPVDGGCGYFGPRNIRCSATNGFIQIVPYHDRFHYKLTCVNDHYVRNVRHKEVAVYLGLPAGTQCRTQSDPLDPPRRIELFVLLRDRGCIVCGRRQGTPGADGNRTILGVDHIIPKRLIKPDVYRLDRELMTFARDIQTVTHCGPHNSAKGGVLLPLEDALAIFIEHVLRGNTAGTNLGRVSDFQRLYRLAKREFEKGA